MEDCGEVITLDFMKSSHPYWLLFLLFTAGCLALLLTLHYLHQYYSSIHEQGNCSEA